MRCLKIIPSHPCFTSGYSTHSCLRSSHRLFSHLHFVLTLLGCFILRRVQPLPLCREGCASVDWMNNHFSQHSRCTNDDQASREQESFVQWNKDFLPRSSRKSNGGRTSIHCNREPATAELLLRIIVSVNRFSVHRAVVVWCQGPARRNSSSFSIEHGESHCESQVPSADLSMVSMGVQYHRVKFENLPENLQLF